MYCQTISYRGCIIYKNVSPEFGTYYWSVANLREHPNGDKTKHCHAHGKSRVQCELIVDCYQNLRKGKYYNMKHYSIHTRNEALRLMNTYVHECY